MNAAVVPCNDTLRRYQPMVARIARHLIAKLPASVELDDIVQAGMIGLMDAATRYRDDQGTQFETFASQRVRGAMLDELRQNDWAPRGVRRGQRALDGAIHALQQRLGRAPRDSEIASELGVTPAQYCEMLTQARAGHVLSYDGWDADDESPAHRLPADFESDPLRRLEDKRFAAALAAAIEALPERSRTMMALYYQEDLNFREIAAVLGVTESRICQMHTKAVALIRARLKD